MDAFSGKILHLPAIHLPLIQLLCWPSWSEEQFFGKWIERATSVQLPQGLYDALTVLVSIRLQMRPLGMEIANVEKAVGADTANALDRLVAAVAGSKHKFARLVA